LSPFVLHPREIFFKDPAGQLFIKKISGNRANSGKEFAISIQKKTKKNAKKIIRQRQAQEIKKKKVKKKG
jgi:hypothetical protein